MPTPSFRAKSTTQAFSTSSRSNILLLLVFRHAHVVDEALARRPVGQQQDADELHVGVGLRRDERLLGPADGAPAVARVHRAADVELAAPLVGVEEALEE